MEKEKIINDIKFKQKCHQYILNEENCEVYKDVILLNSPTEGVYVFLDKDYNVFNIEKSNQEHKESLASLRYYDYCDSNTNDIFEDSFPYPFETFTLQEIIDLSHRIKMIESKYGCSSIVKISNDIDLPKTEILSYIKFLGKEINQYFLQSYHMQTLGFEFPDVYEYVRTLMTKIDECVETHIKQNKRPWPTYILNSLGQNSTNLNVEEDLYGVVQLLMDQKGYKIKDGSIDEIEKISLAKEDDNFEMSAFDIYNILSLTGATLTLEQEQKNEYSDTETKNRVYSKKKLPNTNQSKGGNTNE